MVPDRRVAVGRGVGVAAVEREIRFPYVNMLFNIACAHARANARRAGCVWGGDMPEHVICKKQIRKDGYRIPLSSITNREKWNPQPSAASIFILGGNPGKADCRVFRAQWNVNTYTTKRKGNHPSAKNIPFCVCLLRSAALLYSDRFHALFGNEFLSDI